MIYRFPEDFLIGTATSSFQIETPVDHQLKGLVAHDGSKLTSTIAHEKHRKRDISLISRLGKAYRFSLDWGRLQEYPFEPFHKDVVDEYRKFMLSLKEKGVTLCLVLHHFANPNWFENLGAWSSPHSIEIYLDYVRQVKKYFGDLIWFYDTFNEPGVYAIHCYVSGFFPPYKRFDLISAEKVLRNMSKSSNMAYDILKKGNKKAKVGFAKSLLNPLPVNLFGKFSAILYKKIFVYSILKKFSSIDYVGLNYYGEMPMGALPLSRIDDTKRFDGLRMEHDDLWITDPLYLKKAIHDMRRRYGKPVLITENGYCGDKDKRRIRFIKEHLKSVYEAMEEGADVLGYMYWSTFDNFELYLGRSFRFGLVEIDYDDMTRMPKGSAKFYQKLVKTGSFEFQE
ncbi:MAG: family 1 glycosylhydrolase [Candidatus Woesearchaeota archaeon]